jgi:hypothetical protein
LAAGRCFRAALVAINATPEEIELHRYRRIICFERTTAFV